MKGIFTEKNIVVILFVMVLITFSLAQNETKKIEQLNGLPSSSINASPKLEAKANLHVLSVVSSSE